MFPFGLIGEGVSMHGRTLPKRVSFGVFEADFLTGELRKHGLRVRLQRQSFDVLAVLLETPGEIVSREQLQLRLWRGETFVQFDRAINKAVTHIRRALGDEPISPRFVETVAGRGYRFIAPMRDSRTTMGTEGYVDQVLRSSLLPPPNVSFLPNHFAISPDGTRLAFVAAGVDGYESIWIRDLASGRVSQLEGTGGARLPFWSPDSRHLGFLATGRLNTIDIAGGAIRTVCESRAFLGAAWHSTNVIVFAPSVSGPLYKVPASGGTPMPATSAPPEQSSQLHCWPAFVPDSDDFLFFVNRSGPHDALGNGLHAASLSSDEVTLISSEIDGNVACACGYVLYRQKGSLMAQPYEDRERRLSGNQFAIVQHELQIWERAWFQSGFSISRAGVVVFQSSRDFSSELVWLDDSGAESSRLPLRGCQEPAISPDGTLLAYSSDELNDGRWTIGIYDLERGVASRLTEGPNDWHPSWSNDGTDVIFDQIEGYLSSTWRTAADRSGSSRRILPLGSVIAHESANGDVAFMDIQRAGPVVRVCSPGNESPVLLAGGAEPRFSPDGKWLAYVDIGGGGIVVKRFPGPGPGIQISNGIAAQPRWSNDGKRLYFITYDRKLAEVSYDLRTGRSGAPRTILQTRIIGSAFVGFQYDVSRDGRYLVNSLPSCVSPLTLLTGWQSLSV